MHEKKNKMTVGACIFWKKKKKKRKTRIITQIIAIPTSMQWQEEQVVGLSATHTNTHTYDYLV